MQLEMLLSFFGPFRAYFASRVDLQAQILALRHQIVVFIQALEACNNNATVTFYGSGSGTIFANGFNFTFKM
jgi:hypothetical protein